MKDIRWRIILTIIVIGGAALIAYPPQETVTLGLDLQGGSHFVVRVITDDLLDAERNIRVDRLNEVFTDEGMIGARAVADDGLGIKIEGVPPDKRELFEDIVDDRYQEWDQEEGAEPGSYTMTFKPTAERDIRNQAVNQTLEGLRNRVDAFGVTEPVIQRYGLVESERIVIQLPGIEDSETIKEKLKEPAFLEWKLVAGPFQNTEDAILAPYNGVLPDGMEIRPYEPKDEEGNVQDTGFILLERAAVVTGRNVKDARRSVDDWGRPAVSFRLDAEGASEFFRVSSDHIGDQAAIVLDGKVISAPVFQSAISDQGIIQGSFTVQGAELLSAQIRSGALPAGVEYLEERSVGPSLGYDSIVRGIYAALLGLALVILFMLFYYRGAGINAVLALAFNMVLVVGALAYLKATLTLPGIAGFILTIGMAVDANVLIFERIKEETRLGKNVRSAVTGGFGKAFWTIFDANVTTLIAAVLLFQFGTGPIKGFAVTLSIGILASMFTAIFVSRTIFELILGKPGRRTLEKLSI